MYYGDLFLFTGVGRFSALGKIVPLLKLLLVDWIVLCKVLGPDNGALLSSDGLDAQITNTPSLGL